jgi:DNA-binding GntR family transcriptional regulator
MQDDGRKVPTHELTYARLRDMVLFGDLAPGQPVTIQGLIRDLDAGMTPVREALRRLIAEGALVLQDNRRVSVPRLTAGMLDELAFARNGIEPRLAELAAPHVDAAAQARLVAIDADIEPAIRAGDIHAYLSLNHAFHFALYEHANAPVLLDLARSLWLRFGPALREVVALYGTSGLPDRHAEALAALAVGDAAGVARAMAADIADGVGLVRQALEAGQV